MENELRVTSLYQSGMVLQRDTKNCVSGTCRPGVIVSVVFRKCTYTSKSDSDGNWKILFNPGKAGGPDELSIACSEGGLIKLSNVYTGEVWLCSGQSNMQLPMNRLCNTYPAEMKAPVNEQIRIFTVPISYSFDGEKNTLEGGSWKAAGPDTIESFSGTSYFFAKKVQQELKIPVGILNASQGGSPIASWLDSATVKKWSDLQQRLDVCKDDSYVAGKKQAVQNANDAWYKKCAAVDIGFKEQWNAEKKFADKTWEDFQIPGKKDIFTGGGSVWFKKEFTLTESEIRAITLLKTKIWLGTIIDSDTVWINGVECGSTGYQYPPRRYEIPSGVLRKGKNEITIRVVHNGKTISFEDEKPYFIFTENVLIQPTCPGNFIGTKDDAEIGKNAVCIDLRGVWKMKEGCSIEEKPSDYFFEWEPTALYNSMLAPCFTMAVKGFIWYQGESDTGNPQNYETQLGQLISLWRKKFTYSAGDKAPFIIVQLPNYGKKLNAMKYSGWAMIRDAERDVAYKNKNCGLVVTIDVGDWNDLHPENKEAVGTRCAYEALRLAYGRKTPVSPSINKVKKTDDGVIIEMKNDITCLENEMPTIICILKDVSGGEMFCKMTVQALAHEKIIASLPPSEMGKKFKITEVRYAWCDSPEKTVLYDKTGKLPAVPFRVEL